MSYETVNMVAVRPVFDSTTGTYYEVGALVPMRKSILDGDAPREVESPAKGGMVPVDKADLAELMKAQTAKPAGYDAKGPIVAGSAAATTALAGAQPAQKAAIGEVEVAEGGPSRKRTAKPKADPETEARVNHANETAEAIAQGDSEAVDKVVGRKSLD